MAKFRDERDERAWVSFVSALLTRETPQYRRQDVWETDMFEMADRLLLEVHKRRNDPEDGPFR